MGLEDLVHVVRPSEGPPEGALVFFHGRGADEHDLYPLLDILDPQRRLVGVTPRGPLSQPPGGAHWYVLRDVGRPDPETFRSTFALIEGWLDAFLAEQGLTIDRAILGGFSQGSVMAYSLSLGAGRPAPAGLIAFSGFMPEVADFEFDLESRADFRVAIGHGSHDPMIDVSFSRQAREVLEEAGCDVTYKETPMAHTIDPEYLAFLIEWVEATLDL